MVDGRLIPNLPNQRCFSGGQPVDPQLKVAASKDEQEVSRTEHEAEIQRLMLGS